MQLKTTLFTLALALWSVCAVAQTKYIDPMFGVSEPVRVVYGQNVDVLIQGINQLEADVYTPQGDNETLRPVVVVFPTGNFLPQYINQGPYGSLRDSAAVEIINQVVSRGFVGMVAEYRAGWNPVSTDQDVRTSTLLQAAYRGGQDAHTLARYLRKSVVEDNNPYQIDTSRIVFWGLGTGGYVVLTHAFLDDIEEVLEDDRFYDANDQPYVSLAVNADPQGTRAAAFPSGSPSNIPNHVAYTSDVAMTINANGALGDLDWMEGSDNEPIVLGYHSPSDPFAPFNVGTVIVPTTGDVVISQVAGTNAVLAKAQDLGLNDAITEANALQLPDFFPPLSSALNQINAVYKTLTIDLSALGQPSAVQLSYDDMFPISVGDTRSPSGAIGSTYNWIDSAQVRIEIAAVNAVLMQTINASAVISNESLTNPNAYDGAGARVVIDTMIAHFLPRAWYGLNLEEPASNELVQPSAIGLEVFPNPASEGFNIRIQEGLDIRSLRVMDLNGRVVFTREGINASNIFVGRGNLPRGNYVVQLQLDEGTVAKMVVVR